VRGEPALLRGSCSEKARSGETFWEFGRILRWMRTSKNIFQLLSEYHTSLDNMRSWLHDSTLDEVERMGIIDAWQEEMRQYFKKNGFCFACNRPLLRCRCIEAL
jgi:hypothetical protein